MTPLSRNINAIDRYLMQKRRAYMEPLGLKGIHAWLCVTICDAPGASQDQIVRKLWFDKSTIGRQVEVLEEQGFVTRRPSEKDKRVLCVYPTEKMSQFQPELDAAMQTWEQALLQDLTLDERQQLSTILAKIRDRIGPEV